MSTRQHRLQDDQSDTLTLVWATSVFAAFISLLIDLRLCVIIAAFGVFWILCVMNRYRTPSE
jgi:hypothetical protein